MNTIDLRSDTVTKPCSAMRNAMHTAQVGDDVYGEDPTVNELEEYAANLLGKQAALFAPSGTQSNLLALLSHCQRGDEYIVGQTAHTFRFEGGGAAVLGGISPQPLDFAQDGSLDLDQVTRNIKPDDFHFANTTLLCLENTQGGRALSLEYINQARALCEAKQLSLHLDGARFFNAVQAIDSSPAELAAPFNSISICLSKGLGAPVGSVLIGSSELIKKARRWRKMLGGGMRQAGVIAAGGLYALKHNRDRLGLDHQHAESVANTLNAAFGKQIGDESGKVAEQHTNMLHLSLPREVLNNLTTYLANQNIRISGSTWVFHLDIDANAVDRLQQCIADFSV